MQLNPIQIHEMQSDEVWVPFHYAVAFRHDVEIYGSPPMRSHFLSRHPKISQDIPSPSDPKSCQWWSTNLGARHVAEALPWAQQGTARLPGLRAKAEYIRAPAVNNVSTPNLRRFEERVCWNKKSINQFPIPMHKTHVYVYVYVYIYIFILYTWLLAFVKTLDPLWASKSLGFMDVPKIWCRRGFDPSPLWLGPTHVFLVT